MKKWYQSKIVCLKITKMVAGIILIAVGNSDTGSEVLLQAFDSVGLIGIGTAFVDIGLRFVTNKPIK